MASSVCVVVVNYNTAQLLPRMFASLDLAASHPGASCIVIDNASNDASVEVMRSSFPQHRLLVNEANVGFGRANNQALPYVDQEYVLLLNTDAFVSPDTLSRTIEYMDANPAVGILGVRLTGEDGELQPSCRFFPTPLNVFLLRTGLNRLLPWVRLVDDMDWNHASVRECDWVPGCYFLIRRTLVDDIGLFDQRYFLYYEEVDLCRRAKQAGWKVVYYPHTSVIHIGGESAKSDGKLTTSGRQLSALQIESELLYFRRHHGRLGLALHMVLVTLGDMILAAKALLKRRGTAAVAECWKHFRITWRLLAKTRLATRPTR
ncbi:MAG: glycosyltransferase family 2 protein [Gammaproteobacteria bacterium]|nr:glycosyltransferase family 2 protein [Gammaproteobacteria bacterium]MBU1415590.1 glycosyltransferase family 2 protein [Gammaproteobacteria bacterium]